MGLGGFTLADRLGAKSVPCRVAGCTRTRVELPGTLGQAARGRSAPAAEAADGATDKGLCEPCRKKRASLKDEERSCDRPGCDGKWSLSAEAQLTAWVRHEPAGKGLCARCESELATLSEKEIACATPGCTRPAKLSPRAQLLGQGPADALCGECARAAERFKDRAVGCGINRCKNKWLWRAAEQVAWQAAGKPVDPPPRRMCDECRAVFGGLLDREVRCRTSGCKNTWIWSRSDQLDACEGGKPPPKAPHHMCERCFGLWSGFRDLERPCRKSGCKNTWTDRRGAQLARAVRGKTGDPYPRFCPEHEKEAGELQDVEVACRTDGCDGTWTWTRDQQVAAGVRPRLPDDGVAVAASGGTDGDGAIAGAPAAETMATGGEAASPEAAGGAAAPGRPDKKKKGRREVKPPSRRCQACTDFLKDKKTMEIPCQTCGTPIYWPPESQLQTHLGHWAMPTLCGACKRDATEAARLVAKEAIKQQIIAQAAAAGTTGVSASPLLEGEPAPDSGSTSGSPAAGS